MVHLLFRKHLKLFLVHVADDTDAKCDVMRNVLKGVKPGEFSSKVVAMDNIELYKKKSE